MADIKISQLGEVLAVTDNDILPMTASGVTSKVKASTMKSYMVDDLDVSDLHDTTITSVANEDGLVYNSTSQKWENKQIVQKNQISNPNLLDNPWFTINQRGAASYTAGDVYTVDRWKRGAVDASGHSLVLGASTRGQVTVTQLKGSIFQMIEAKDFELQNKVYTMSAVIDGTLCSASFTPVNDGQTHSNYYNTGIDGLLFEITENYNGVHEYGINNSNATSDHAITKMKLELGSFSTLLLDSQPNYEAELLKCQRYYIRIGTGSVAALGMGQAIANNNVCIHIPLTVPIRTSPAINLIGTAFLRNGSTYISSLSSSHMAGDTYDTNEVSFRFAPPLADAVQGAVYECYLDANSYFEIGADL